MTMPAPPLRAQALLRLLGAGAAGAGAVALGWRAWAAGAACNTHYLVLAQFCLQDRWLLPATLALAALCLAWPMRRGASTVSGRAVSGRAVPGGAVSGGAVAALVAGVAGLGWAGHYVVLAGYGLSRDEQMAAFDAFIYGHGRLAWPLPPGWRALAGALNSLFMLPVAQPVAWVSAYLPGNALLLAAAARVGDAALAGPACMALALAATWGAGRRLWRGAQGREASALAVLLLATSGQFLFTGMSFYAMNAHLAANALWLWLFLADRRRADAAAILLGFAATGLHQPLFHPLFVAPWLAMLLAQGRWRRGLAYGLAYGAIGLFWLHWPHVTLAAVSGAGAQAQPGVDFAARLAALWHAKGAGVPFMAYNLLRFALWQSLPMLPLAGLGLWQCWRQRQPRLWALAAGLVAPFVVMAVLLPDQGYGMGYRYAHQVLGNAALLAGEGWLALGGGRARLRPLVGRALALSLVLLAVQGVMLHRLYATSAALSARLAGLPADYVLVGADDAPFVADLVLNRPDLANRPLRLLASEIDAPEDLAARICPAHPRLAHPRLAMPEDSLFAPLNALYGQPPAGLAHQRLVEDGPVYAEAGCVLVAARLTPAASHAAQPAPLYARPNQARQTIASRADR